MCVDVTSHIYYKQLYLMGRMLIVCLCVEHNLFYDGSSNQYNKECYKVYFIFNFTF